MKTTELHIIGDTHNPRNYFPLVERLRRNADENVDIHTIQLGDLGMGLIGNKFPAEWDKRDMFIRGNHDNPEMCKKHPNYLGDYGHIEKWDLFYFGGAYTPQWADNRTRADFFPDEEMTYDVMMQAMDLYDKVKPRFVVTHDAPQIIINLMHTQQVQCLTTQFLDNLLQLHQPTTWYFGHHHFYKEFRYGPTNLICIPMNDSVEVINL